MTGKYCIAWAAALSMLAGVYGLSLSGARAEDAPQSESGSEAGNPSKPNEVEAKAPRSPIRIKTIDFVEAKEGPGKLKLAGTAAPGTTIYLFIDLDPYAKVLVDDDGNWSLEGDLELDEQQHRLRAEQYDPVTRMLSGRAMITIGRNKANAEP